MKRADCAPSDILAFWFGPEHSERVPNTGEYMSTMLPYWGGGHNLMFDIAQKSARPLMQRIAAGECTGGDWDTPRGKLAKIIVLDQMTRCAYRGTKEAFLHDELACRLSLDVVNSGAYEEFSFIEKFWVTISLSHSENIEENALHAELGRCLADGQPADVLEFYKMLQGMGFPHEHEDCVKRFGRFPHRNKILGRISTPEECEWLSSDEVPGWARSQDVAKLIYWDERGMGDTVRFLLEFCMIPYEEENVTSAEQFQQFKESGRAPFDQVPVLEMDGLQLGQTAAILRYIAAKKNILGTTPREQWAADAAAAACADHRMPLITIPAKDDPGAARHAWVTVNLPKLAAQLDRMAQKSGADGSWIAGASFTYADVVIYELFNYAEDVCKDEVDAQLALTPRLKDILRRVGEFDHLREFVVGPSRRPIHDEGFVRRVFAILGLPLPKYMRLAE